MITLIEDTENILAYLEFKRQDRTTVIKGPFPTTTRNAISFHKIRRGYGFSFENINGITRHVLAGENSRWCEPHCHSVGSVSVEIKLEHNPDVAAVLKDTLERGIHISGVGAFDRGRREDRGREKHRRHGIC
jgi:hypothetical protein